MAYSGRIQIMDMTFGDVEWVGNLRFNNKPNEQSRFIKEWKSTLVIDIGSFRKCNFKRRGTGCAILDFDNLMELMELREVGLSMIWRRTNALTLRGVSL
jgi:hypothetical protein